MNEPNPPGSPPPLTPVARSPLAPSHLTPLGALPGEQEPINTTVGAIEAILREPRRVLFQTRQPGSGRMVLKMLAMALLCALVYGLVVGSFSMGTQFWAAPAKIAVGLLVSALICLPSLYIFACLSGSTARLSEICAMVAGLLLLTTVLLIGFAPVAWLFSQSSKSVLGMGFLHLLFWAVATFFGMRFLKTGFDHSQARSQMGLHVWIIIFGLVVLQMTTALRPIVGTSDTLLPKEKKFFLLHWSDCLDAAMKTGAKPD